MNTIQAIDTVAFEKCSRDVPSDYCKKEIAEKGYCPCRVSDTTDPSNRPMSAAGILVVDDSSDLRDTTMMLLNDLGYACTYGAEDGIEALEMIRAQSFDLVLLDIDMPRLDGFGVLRALRDTSYNGDLPIVVTSGLDELDDVVRCIELGADDFLHKPVNMVLLQARVHSLLERKRLRDEERRLHRDLEEQKQLLEIEKDKSEQLLLNILPEEIAHQLKHRHGAIAQRFNDVTILFADLVHFTSMASNMDPEILVDILNDIFSRFDSIAHLYGLEKIKTIGDCYMVVGGLPVAYPDHAVSIAAMALQMLDVIADVNRERGMQLDIRIGINSGPVVAGVIGHKKFAYDLWGNSVNVASRMESSGLPGKIQVTESTRLLLADQYAFNDRGIVECKGLGGVRTSFLLEKKS